MHQPALFTTDPPFDGDTFEPEQDQQRLGKQLGRIKDCLMDGEWWTLYRLAAVSGVTSQASISARIRDLRKLRFGGYTVERKRVDGGLFVYRVVR
jgi:hypothetical protein